MISFSQVLLLYFRIVDKNVLLKIISILDIPLFIKNDLINNIDNINHSDLEDIFEKYLWDLYLIKQKNDISELEYKKSLNDYYENSEKFETSINIQNIF